MNSAIKVSVLTPIYNHNIDYVRQCLESLKSQTLQDIEFILIDNGATPESKALINEYLEQDTRFKVISFTENQGYGKAMNAGLKIAQGEYVGFIESDDWAEPDMYEKLYELAVENDVDVVVAQLFYYYGKTGENKYFNKFPKEFLNKRITEISKARQYVEGVAAHWAKLYRNDMIKNTHIEYNPSKTACPDVGFLYKTFVNAKNIYITPNAYIHYRRDNENSSINSGDIMAQRIKAEQIYITKYLEGINAPQDIWDIKIHQEIQTFCYNYFNRCNKTKLKFIKEISSLFKQHIQKNRVTYKYFTKREKNLFNKIAYHPLLFYLRSLIKDEKADIGYKSFIYAFGLYKKKYTPKCKKYYILGVQFYNKKNKKCSKKNFIFHKEKTLSHNIYTILGIKFKIKNNQAWMNEQRRFYYIQKSNIQAAVIHPQTFGGYKNKYHGQSVVLVGCGPSLKKYNPIQDVIHIGVNRAFMYDKINLDYLFIQDYLKGENDMDLANAYNPETCIKFYGILPDFRNAQVKRIIRKLSNQDICEANANTYIIEDCFTRKFAQHLEWEAIGDLGGCIFSALQFALYTNPQKIYLVGCDCSSDGHFHKENSDVGIDLSPQKNMWISLSGYLETYYPHTQIISVNPVGLKGLFEDYYQGEDEWK